MRDWEIAIAGAGVVAVQVTVGLVAMLGFAVLAVDVGLLYTAQAELQNAADSAALAAASQLGLFDKAEAEDTTVQALARIAAIEAAGKNSVRQQQAVIVDTDIEFGFSLWDTSTGTYAFDPAPADSEDGTNAVRVTVQRTASSGNGPINMVFAGIFGLGKADVAASSTAILVPRDIMIVADLSGSYNDDSELKNYAANDPDGINLYDVWQTLPNSSANGVALQAWLDANPGMSVEDAPAAYFQLNYGFFSQLGSTAAGNVTSFGQTTVNSSYSPSSDSGLIRLRQGYSWSTSELGSTNYTKLRNYLLGMGYSSQEVRWIMADSSGSDSSIRSGDTDSVTYTSDYSDKDRYDLRAAVALGLVYWNSGSPGGLGSTNGWTGGNNDWKITTTEIVDNIAYPFPDGNWFEYVAYMRDASNSNDAYDALTSLKHRLGPKTFVNFLLEEKELNSETDVTHFAHANPLNLTKNALDVLMDDLASLQSADQMGLVTYGTYAVMDYNLPGDTVTLADNATAIKTLYRSRQAAHYAPSTNIGQGIEIAADELDPDLGSNARPEARKIIVLLTDGMANINESGSSSTSGGIAYATSAAQAAWDDHRVMIYAIGVGSGADMDTLDTIAEYGKTQEGFWANGTFEEIEEELTGIFRKIGGMRSTQLIN